MKLFILILLSLIIISVAYVMVIDAQAQDCPGQSCDPLPPKSEGCENSAPGQNPHCDDHPKPVDTPDPEDQPTPTPEPERTTREYYLPVLIQHVNACDPSGICDYAVER